MSPCQPQRWQQQLAVETLDCGKRSGACEFMNLHALKDGSSRTIVFTGIVAPGAAPGRHGARVDFCCVHHSRFQLAVTAKSFTHSACKA